MDTSEFEFILEQGEGQFIEFKESFEPKSLSKEIVAFANSLGGKIFLGVSDKGDVLIEIFKNKLIISNPGGLVKWLKPEDFGKFSRTRNQLIAELLSKTKYVEKIGSGIHRMQDAMKKANLPKLVFDYNHSFVITLFDEKKSIEKVGEKVGEIEIIILKTILKNNKVTYAEMAKAIKISEKSVFKNIAKLKQKGFLKRIGSDKGGYWEIQ